MRWILLPGYAVCRKLTMGVNLGLICALLILGWVLASQGGGARYWSAAFFGAGLYLLVSLVSGLRYVLRRIGEAAERIAGGDLSMRLSRRSGGNSETDVIWGSIVRMSANLARLVGEVRAGAGSILGGAREIADGHAHLSERTDRQASTLQETAGGMEELASTVRQNAEGAGRASRLAGEASGVAATAAESMQRLTATIGQIDAGSRRIAEIIGVIDGIAFQTNILALNAAVEAARAGEQGRGFAVVASEVRGLAQRCADAAREVRAMIQSSATSVDEGARLASETAETLARAVAAAAEVRAGIQDIAHASDQQSAGVEEIKRALEQLDDMTQQNAALVEQSAAAAGAFRETAERLGHAVEAIKVDRGEARAQAIALVRRGIAHLGAQGAARAFADFSDPQGGYVEGERYLVVLDLRCVVRAHGGNPALVGNDDSRLTDEDGKAFSAEFIRVARERGQGWVDYRFMNPRHRRVEAKSSYVERAGDYVFACGIYRTEEAGAARPDEGGAPRTLPRVEAVPRIR